MKFAINRSQLLNTLNIVSKAVSSKNPLVILRGIKFDLTNDGLTLTASDSDLSIVSKIAIENNITIFETGSVVLDARYITEIVRKISSDIIELETIEENVLNIHDSYSNFSLNCMVATDYPNIEFNYGSSDLKLSSLDLSSLINQTSFAASDKETRPILTGINLKAHDHLLEAVATDSYRLAKKIIEIDSDCNFDVTLPAKTLNEINKIIENESNVEIKVSESKVIFIFKSTVISTRVIAGAYPNTSKLIPTNFEYTLNTLAPNLISAIDRASLLSSDRNNIVKLSMKQDRVSISSRSQEVGSATETISSFNYNGVNLDISFTSKYVLDAVKSLGCDEIVILFNGDMKPFIIKSKNDESCIQLVLPVRTY